MRRMQKASNKERCIKTDRQHQDEESDSSESAVDIRGMEKKLKAKNTLILDLMDVMDNILQMEAKIEIVNALDQDIKIQLQETLQANDKQNDQQRKK